MHLTAQPRRHAGIIDLLGEGTNPPAPNETLLAAGGAPDLTSPANRDPPLVWDFSTRGQRRRGTPLRLRLFAKQPGPVTIPIGTSRQQDMIVA